MPQTNRDELIRLLTSRHALISIVTGDEDHALDVVREAALETRQQLFVWDCVNGLRDGLVAKQAPLPDTQTAGGGLAWVEKHLDGQALFCFLDLVDHLDGEPATRRMLKEAVNRVEAGGGAIVLIDHKTPPPLVRELATTLDLAYPSEEELHELVRRVVRQHHRSVKPVHTHVTGSDVRGIVSNLRGLTRRQAQQAILDVVAIDQRLDADDVEGVLKHKKQSLAGGGLLQFVDAPLDLDDVGGLANLKRWLALRDEADSQRAIDFGIEPPRGLLLLGVQGAGKSLASKAVATAWRRPLVRLDVGALYDRYVGESEKRLRDALKQAEMMSPCVLWIDEVEKAFAGAAAQSNDGGLSRRMFGALLTWMQEHREPVFLIATANDVTALPPELLRKGRFDEIFFVDLPEAEARRRIFEIHLAKRKRDPEAFDLSRLVELSDGYTGAEIEQAILSALYDAFALHGELTTDGIVSTLRASVPLSVTRREQVMELRAWAQDRCVPAD